MNQKIIEAAPGFYLLDFYIANDDGYIEVNKTPLLGWAVSEDASTGRMKLSALVPGGDYSSWEYMLMPNGEVCDMYGSSFTYNNWLDMARDELMESTDKGAAK